MGKKKLRRFAENATFPNMFQRGYEELLDNGFELKGRWREDFFRNKQPLILELACGKGEYTVDLARRYPAKNFIGIDIKGARMWKGCKISNEENLENVAFIRTHIDLIGHFFGTNEVDEIWITFPDPQPRKSKRKKRLVSPEFLHRYKDLLKDEGILHLKTDDDGLFAYTKEVIEDYRHPVDFESKDIYGEGISGVLTEIQTFYEKMWLEEGKKIKYISFRLNKSAMYE